MVIVKILGGLGNQMFQYAYAKALSEKGYDIKLDISEFDTYDLHGGYHLNKFKINLEIATKAEIASLKAHSKLKKMVRKITFKNKCILKEKKLLFNKELLCICDNTYIYGYFQSEKYFRTIKADLLRSFTLNHIISNYGILIYNKILNSKSSCSIHIRRGDYLNSTNNNIFGTCSLDYYQSAISLINDKFEKATYFIFSNDIEWSKNNLKINNAIFIDTKEERIPNEDIYLMSLCKNNIIANSSFSWWGSWLNKNDKKIIIAPKNWFVDEKLLAESIDIVPDNYIKL